MKKRLALLFAAGLVISSGVAWYQIAPGYMDAEYYLLGGQSLVQGNGFWEPVL